MAIKKIAKQFLSQPAEKNIMLRSQLKMLRAELSQIKESYKNLQDEYQQLLNYESHGIRMINKDFTVRLVNQTFTRMSGTMSGEFIGKKCYELFPGPYCHTPNCRLMRILGGESFIQDEIERVKPDGQVIPCIVNAAPLCNKKGELDGIIETFTDITEKRQLEGQVEESEERYRALVELGSEAGEAIVMLQDIDGVEGLQTFVSDQWPRITKYSKNELLGMSFFKLLNANDRQYSIDRHREKMAGHSVPGIYNMAISRKDGMPAKVEITGAYTNYQGKRANVLYIRDITERDAIQAALSASEERYRGLFQNAPVGIMEIDYSIVKQYFDTLANRGVTNFRQYFMHNPEELWHCIELVQTGNINEWIIHKWETQTRKEFTNHLISSHHKQLKTGAFRESIIGLAEGKIHFGFEEKIDTAKGNQKYLKAQISVSPGYEDSLARVYVCFLDISDLKEAEHKLKQYQEHLEDIVKGRTQQLMSEIERRKQAEQASGVLYLQEKTLRKQLEEQNKQRNEFVRALVHEIKTPLTSTMAASELLLANAPDEIQQRLAHNIHEGTFELNARIDELFDLAKSEIGMLKVKPAMTDLKHLLDEVLETILPLTQIKCQSLTSEIDPSLPECSIDATRIRQVLLNILNNAVKFTPHHGKITLSADNLCMSFQIKISDNGPGISKEEQRYLFEPYHILDVKAERFSGLGLGLSISKTLVELHGGRLWVESRKGRGSSFCFNIPYTFAE